MQLQKGDKIILVREYTAHDGQERATTFGLAVTADTQIANVRPLAASARGQWGALHALIDLIAVSIHHPDVRAKEMEL